MAIETPASPFDRSHQHDAKRAAILSQAAKLFNYKGSRATTLRDIAESLGLTKTSLYYYVRNKEDLTYQCYKSALDHHHRNLDTIEDRFDNPIERISAYLHSPFEHWITAREGRAPHIAALLEIAALKDTHREEVEARYIDMFKRVRQYLRDGMAAGTLRNIEANSATRVLIGSVEWVFSWAHQLDPGQLEKAGDQAVDIVSHGFYAGKEEYLPLPPAPQELDHVGLQGFNREEQNRQKQEAFFKAGTWFFNKKGFNGTSLDEIAEHLNVSKGAFYYHIKNKEDLLFHCYSRSLDIVENIYGQAAQSEGSGLQKIDLSFRRTFHAQASDQGPLIRYNTITAIPIGRRRKIVQRTDEANRRFSRFLDEGVKDGSVREINNFVAQQMIAGAINAAMDIKLWRPLDDLDAAAIDYFDVFLNGLIPRG